jgi:hypothetical protein
MTPVKFLATAILHTGDKCLLWPFSVNTRGYPQMRWEGTTREVHRILCRLAHGEPKGGAVAKNPDASHSCATPRCISPQHVRWKTRKENIAEGTSHTNDQNGERNKMVCLTTKQVLAIRADPRSGSAIGRDYGITQTHVSKIKRRERWAHIP